MPGQQLVEGTGHWVWSHDIGFKETLQEHIGYLGFALAVFLENAFGDVPHHWFRLLEDGRWEMKRVSAGTGPRGRAELFNIPEEGDARAIKGQDGSVCIVRRKVYWEGEKLVFHMYGTSDNGKEFNEFFSKEIIGGFLYSWHEDTKGLRRARVFKQYPYYSIRNETGQAVTLRMYDISDVMRLVPAAAVVVPAGCSFIDASGPDVEEEQAVFTLKDRSSYKGLTLRPYHTYVLTPRNFS